MPRWKEGTSEFTVTVNKHEHRGYQVNIPKPIMEVLGEPDKITFEITKGKKVEIEAAEPEKD